MEPLKPDDEGATYTELSPKKLKVPEIIISSTAMHWIEAIVDEHNLEVGFYGIVDEREDGSYFVRDILYPKHQAMEMATCEISPQGEEELIDFLINEGREDDIPKAKRFWGHSHHNMGTGSSPQDDKQAMELIGSSHSYLIRAICNKRGSMSISFFDYKAQLRFDHVPFKVEYCPEESLLVEKYSKVIEVINSTNKSEKTKLIEINNILSVDNEKDQIIKWVKELKVKNTPEVKPHGGYHGMIGRRKKNQQNMFISQTKGPVDEEDGDENEFEGPFFNQIAYGADDAIYEEQISNLIDEYRNERK